MSNLQAAPRALAPPFSYDKWVQEGAERINAERRANARVGICGGALYVLAARGAEPGALVYSLAPVAGAVDVVRFPTYGTSLAGLPYSDLPSLLWHACRSLPICPTEWPAPATADSVPATTDF